MKYLIDTNIILEILFKQKKKELCKKFLVDHRGNLNLSTFSLYSIGIHYFKKRKAVEFKKLIQKFSKEFEFHTLTPMQLQLAVEGNQKFNLDFDDAFHAGGSCSGGVGFC